MPKDKPTVEATGRHKPEHEAGAAWKRDHPEAQTADEHAAQVDADNRAMEAGRRAQGGGR